MFLSRNKKNNVCPCKLQFYYIKVGFKGVKIIQVCFCDNLLPDMVQCLTLRGSNKLYLEQIFMVQGMFDAPRFDCILHGRQSF